MNLSWKLMTDQEVTDAKVTDAIMKGKIDSFEWVGSLSISGIGVRMYAVDFLNPTRHHTETAFIPVEVIDFRLCA